jgi:hypothetical protein
MNPKPDKQPQKQANFAWFPILAGGSGLFAGWKLFGGGNKKETESNPVLFWSMLVLVLVILVGFGFFAYKKWLK